MRLTVVRHARAGSQRTSTGRDEDRPLDELGATHAAALAPVLVAGGVARLVSSPALRCVQTLEPLAAMTGVPIEPWAGLGPHAGPAGLRATFGHPAFDGAVVCTHGELLRPLLRTLRRRSAGRSAAHVDGRVLLAKGSAWVLTFRPDGSVATFEHILPGA